MRAEISVSQINNIATGELAGVISATQMPDLKCNMVMFKARAGNPGNAYIGGAGVTVVDGTTDTTTGYQLDAGDTTPWLFVKNINIFYRICDSVDDGLTYIAVW